MVTALDSGPLKERRRCRTIVAGEQQWNRIGTDEKKVKRCGGEGEEGEGDW